MSLTKVFLKAPSAYSFLDILVSDDQVPAGFLECVLAGMRGKDAEDAARAGLRIGVGYGGDFDLTLPIADFLLMKGRFEVLESLVSAGAPGLTKMQWLDQLATTEPPDENTLPSFLDYAAWRATLPEEDSDEFHMCCRAIELVHTLDPEHPAFARLGVAASQEGEVVRAVLARRQGRGA